MARSQYDSEYYVIETDGEDNHPLLAWGDTDDSCLLEGAPVTEQDMEMPARLIFDDPIVPKKRREMADFLSPGNTLVCTDRVKDILTKLNPYGVQFIPAELEDENEEIIKGYNILHVWNQISAIGTYQGSKLNSRGFITSLHSFSLNKDVLDAINIENRLIFTLKESRLGLNIVHKSIVELLLDAKVTGIITPTVKEWTEDIIFKF